MNRTGGEPGPSREGKPARTEGRDLPGSASGGPGADPALGRAQKALEKLGGRTPEELLAQAGIAVCPTRRPARFGPVTLLARLDPGQKRLELYLEALEPLQERYPWIVRAALAHETFHLLDPHCPGPLAEPAAHLFAMLALDLREFPGDITLPQ
ncbi:MAG TPA: hypothetical protein VNO81_03685 [Candidatus Nitrosotenuis sp.]|jgi:hypothetical protein|nr:hypothetical protein [Candidatus Nitrosotenuis sp.]